MLSYRLDPKGRFVEILGVQGTDHDELGRLLRDILADPGYHNGLGFYRDRRGMVPMTASQLRANLEVLAGTLGLTATRWAYVVSDPANFGMARMAAMLGDGTLLELQIFETPEPAIAWLAERPDYVRSPE